MFNIPNGKQKIITKNKRKAIRKPVPQMYKQKLYTVIKYQSAAFLSKECIFFFCTVY